MRAPISRRHRIGADLASVLDLIYEAPVVDGAWQPALTAVCDFLGAECADLSFIDASSYQFVRVETARIDLDTFGRYLRDFMQEPLNTNPRVPECARLRQDELFVDSQMWRVAERDRLPFFTELMHPLGLHDAMMGQARVASAESQGILLGTHFRSREALTAETRERLQLLLPHIRRACRTEEKLQQARRDNAVLTEALDHVNEAVAMIDRAGRVLHRNRVASGLLAQAGVLSLAHDERLLFSGSEVRSAFARALAQCVGALVWTPDGRQLPPERIAVPRPEGPPLMLTLQPLPRVMVESHGAVALLFIADGATRPAGDGNALRLAYGLSPAEARLAQDLSQGLLLREIAALRDVNYETVRAQLKRIMAKTGARRQSDLMRLMQGFR